MMALCEDIENLGRELHDHLPVVSVFGLATLLDRVTDEHLEVYKGLLRVDRDPRDGQFFLNLHHPHSYLVRVIIILLFVSDMENQLSKLLMQGATVANCFAEQSIFSA